MTRLMKKPKPKPPKKNKTETAKRNEREATDKKQAESTNKNKTEATKEGKEGSPSEGETEALSDREEGVLKDGRGEAGSGAADEEVENDSEEKKADEDDLYEWYAGRVAPKTWRDTLAKTAPSTMSALDMAKEGFAP